MTKVGTSLSVMPPVEALLLPLAITGAAAWLEGATLRRMAIAAALAAFLLAQSVSLLADPRRGGVVFLRPLSPPAWGIALTRREVNARRRSPALPKGIAFQPRPRHHVPRPPADARRAA